MSLSPVKFQKLLMKANHVLLKLIIKVFFFFFLVNKGSDSADETESEQERDKH